MEPTADISTAIVLTLSVKSKPKILKLKLKFVSMFTLIVIKVAIHIESSIITLDFTDIILSSIYNLIVLP